MAWNRSLNEVKQAEVKPKCHNFLLKCAICTFVTLGALVMVTFIWCLPKQDTNVTKTKSQKVETEHKKLSNVCKKNQIAATNQVTSNRLNKPHLPVTNVITAQSNVGRVETLRDGTVVTNKTPIIFKHPFERALHSALRPGRFGASAINVLMHRYSEAEILSMLKVITRPEASDDEKVASLKNKVQQLKECLLLEIEDGRSVTEVMTDLRRRCSMEQGIRREVDKTLREASRSGDVKTVRNVLVKANEICERNGLPPQKAPALYRDEIQRLEAEEKEQISARQKDMLIDLNKQIENSTK